jgi:putative transcriptional regulator
MRLNRIKDVLEDKGISQMWLSKKLGKSFSTVNAYACNRLQPSLDTLAKIGPLHKKSHQKVSFLQILLLSLCICRNSLF